MINECNFAKKTINTYGLDQVIVNININFTRFNDEHRIPLFPLRENDASRRERLGNYLFLKNVRQLHGRFNCYGSRTYRKPFPPTPTHSPRPLAPLVCHTQTPPP